MISMRSTLLTALVALPLALSAEMTDLQQRYLDADSFTRISEYFDGVENTSGRIIYRTDAEERTGHYLSFRYTGSAATSILVEAYEPGKKEATTYTLDWQTTSAGQLVLIGLTGAPWTDKDHNPVAYKITLLDANGDKIETARSFLWGEE